MLERSIAGSSSCAAALPRLAVLLSQQEKLLDHPWSNADVYLYDFRAQQISTLIADLEDEDTLERHQTLVAQIPVPSCKALSVERSVGKEWANPIGSAGIAAVSSWKIASNVFGRIWAFLAVPLFHHSLKRDSSSSATVS